MSSIHVFFEKDETLGEKPRARFGDCKLDLTFACPPRPGSPVTCQPLAPTVRDNDGGRASVWNTTQYRSVSLRSWSILSCAASVSR